ncbi:MAG: branched-chain amino acid ABC transporter permease [Anaerolineae bacterium]
MAAIRPAGDFDTTYSKDMAVLRQAWHWVVTILFLFFLFALPTFASGYIVGIVITIGIWLIAVQGLGILTGYTGQISLGQAAFMAVGAYASTLLVTRPGLSFWLALPSAGLIAGLVGLIFGLPSLRIKGFYLAMATLAAQFIIPWAIRVTAPEITGGVQGLEVPPPQLAGITFSSHRMYPIVIAVVCLTTIAFKNLARTRTGRAFIAIRDNDLAAEVLGINLFTYKLRAFFLSAFYAGLAGSLWAHYLSHVRPDEFGLDMSIWFLGMIIVGGMGSALGPIFGTIFVRLLKEFVIVLVPFLSSTFPAFGGNLRAALTPMVFGLVLMLFLIFEPRGLAHRWDILKAAWRLRPFSH